MTTLTFYQITRQIMPYVDVSNQKSHQQYFQGYIQQYIDDGLCFKINRFYGFNFLAAILSPLYFIINGLYVGLLCYLLLCTLLFNLIIYFNIPYIPIIAVNMLVAGLIANYFVILKLETGIKWIGKKKQKIEDIVEYTGYYMNSYFLYSIIGFPLTFVLTYLLYQTVP